MFQVRERPESRARARAHIFSQTKKKSPRLSSDPRALPPRDARRVRRLDRRPSRVHDRPLRRSSSCPTRASAPGSSGTRTTDEDDEDESSSPRPAGSSMSIALTQTRITKPSGEFSTRSRCFDDPRGACTTGARPTRRVQGARSVRGGAPAQTSHRALRAAGHPGSSGIAPVNPYRRRARRRGVSQLRRRRDDATSDADSSEHASSRSGRLASDAHRRGGGLRRRVRAELAKAQATFATWTPETPPRDPPRTGRVRAPGCRRGGAEGCPEGAEGAARRTTRSSSTTRRCRRWPRRRGATTGVGVLGLCARESAGWTARGSRRNGAGVTDGSCVGERRRRRAGRRQQARADRGLRDSFDDDF